MAFSYHDYTGDNSTTQFSIPFTYQNTSEISVTVDGVAQTGLTFPSSSTVQLASAPASGTLVQVRRTTNLTARAVDFASGSVLTEEDLDDSSIQTFHASQEAIDRANDSIALDTDDKWDATSKVIKNVATPTANTDATNKAYVDTGANNAATSAAAALVSQNAAAASATAAANSATASAGSATTSANEATDSANSATASASSATASANSASAASTSESNAATSAATATTQAALATTNGAAQVSLATTQANNAAASATNSANSATASANSATAAAGSASTATTQAALATTNGAAQVALATTQATNAATSATAAANSATAAATSETNAANSAAAAAAAFDNFDDTYLGSKTSDPTVDNDGNALVSGALYFNSSANEMRVYDGANWIAASSAGTASLLEYKYTATAGQTTFSGSDDASNTLSYAVDNLIVTLNGVVLENGTDYTATSGTSVVLASGAAVSDELNVIAFKSFTTADMVSKTNGGTFVGAVTFDAGANFGDSDKAVFGAGNDLQIYHDGSDSYINDTGTGNLRLAGSSQIDIISSSGEFMAKFIADGASELYHNNGKSLETTSVGVTVNGNLGIGTTSPDALLQIEKSDSGTTIEKEPSSQSGPNIVIHNSNQTANNLSSVQFTNRGTNGVAETATAGIHVKHEAQGGTYSYGSMNFNVTNSAGSYATRMTIDSNGVLLIGKSADSIVNNGISAAGSATGGGHLSVTNDGNSCVTLNRKSSDGSILGFYKDGSAVGAIGSFNGNAFYAGTGCGLRPRTGDISPTNASGSTNDGGVDLGTSSNRFQNIWLSGGAYLGGTATANKLDDYEEGTWTPSLSAETINLTATYIEQVGRYVKVGNLVHVQCRMQGSVTNAGSGARFIEGLPFTNINAGADGGSGSLCPFNGLMGTNYYFATGHGVNNASKFRIKVQTGLDGTLSDINSGTGGFAIDFSYTYRQA
jgi:hypothetical protein